MENGIAKILLVDDTPENIDTLGVLLKKYKRQVALNGEQALKLASTYPYPDLILLDVVMPGMDGYEVCRRLKENKKTHDIPIIFLTSKTDRKDILRGFHIGAQDYITKPFDTNELMARVETHIEIVESRKKLQQVNEWLEDQVSNRTRDLREMNEELIQAKKDLETLDSSKSEFLNLISHEIRTPLNGIIGSLNILKELEVSTETLEFIDILDQSVNRLEHFSMAALDISGLRVRGAKLLKRRPTDIPDLLKRLVEDIRPELIEKSVRVEQMLSENLNQVNIDPDYTFKALRALIDNAVKYSPEGGVVRLGADLGNDFLVCKVSDSGHGFSADTLKEINYLETGSHIDDNPGLGLYLAHLVAEVHGGFLKHKNCKITSGACVELHLGLMKSTSK